MRLEHPKSGTIQQGALFNCALVPGYEGCTCYGLILTARCDLAHGKYSVVNYLPVVSLADWANREMCYLLAKRMHKSVLGSITRTLGNKNVSEYVLETFPLRDIIEKVAVGKELKGLLLKLEQLKLIDATISLGGGCNARRRELIGIEEKQCDALIKELIQGKLPEYYFLDAVDVLEASAKGYVVLLRNMRTLSPDIASRILVGIEEKIGKSDTDLTAVLSFAQDPICMMTGVLRSPDVEHLAQYFANLFVRIGLEDHEDDTIDRHQIAAKG